jgi:hypothetical protein
MIISPECESGAHDVGKSRQNARVEHILHYGPAAGGLAPGAR